VQTEDRPNLHLAVVGDEVPVHASPLVLEDAGAYPTEAAAVRDAGYAGFKIHPPGQDISVDIAIHEAFHMPFEVHSAVFGPLELANMHVCAATRSRYFVRLWPARPSTSDLPSPCRSRTVWPRRPRRRASGSTGMGT
jgi:L-alanine-DL-glutamate epimerase-like enolase superfamily enzyme